MSDWRYWITYEGIVTADNEDDAKRAAQDDADAGKLPTVEVEEVGEGE